MGALEFFWGLLWSGHTLKLPYCVPWKWSPFSSLQTLLFHPYKLVPKLFHFQVSHEVQSQNCFIFTPWTQLSQKSTVLKGWNSGDITDQDYALECPFQSLFSKVIKKERRWKWTSSQANKKGKLVKFRKRLSSKLSDDLARVPYAVRISELKLWKGKVTTWVTSWAYKFIICFFAIALFSKAPCQILFFRKLPYQYRGSFVCD